MNKRWGGLEVLAWVSVGIFVGLVAYTFQYAEGISYFSNDPKACINCHVMKDHYNAWRKSSHHGVATCNDCHVPHAFPAKWLAKAENGWNHSVKFTLRNYKMPIKIQPANYARLRDNCVRCHGEQISKMDSHPIKVSDAMHCAECHTAVGHHEL